MCIRDRYNWMRLSAQADQEVIGKMTGGLGAEPPTGCRSTAPVWDFAAGKLNTFAYLTVNSPYNFAHQSSKYAQNSVYLLHLQMPSGDRGRGRGRVEFPSSHLYLPPVIGTV